MVNFALSLPLSGPTLSIGIYLKYIINIVELSTVSTAKLFWYLLYLTYGKYQEGFGVKL